MRSVIALLLTATPALAHTGHGAPVVHVHETYGFWIAASAFIVALGLSGFAALKAARVKA